MDIHRDLCSRKARARIQANTVSTSATIHFDLTGVRLEILRRVLSRDTALDSEATLCDGLLGEP